MKDGMELDVWKYLVLQIHFIMVLNVFVLIQKIFVSHGNIMMEQTVFINQENVQ